jgi:hypothetical protein
MFQVSFPLSLFLDQYPLHESPGTLDGFQEIDSIGQLRGVPGQRFIPVQRGGEISNASAGDRIKSDPHFVRNLG